MRVKLSRLRKAGLRFTMSCHVQSHRDTLDMTRPWDRSAGMPVTSYRFVVFTLISLAYVLVYFHRTSTAVLVPELVAAFQVDTAAMGLFGSMYFYAYALCQLPAGILADRWGARKTTSASMLLAGAGTFLLASSSTFGQALVSRFLVGIGVAFVYVCGMRLLADWFKKDEFATYTGFFTAFGNSGAMVSAAPLVALIAAVGWRDALTISGVATVFIALLLYALMRNKPADIGVASPNANRGIKAAADPPAGVGESLSILVRKYNFWTIAILFFVLYGTQMGFQGLWAGPYLMNVYQMTSTQAGYLLLLIPAGLIVDGPTAGLITDHIIKSPKTVVIIGIVINLITWLMLISMIDSMSWRLLQLVMFIYGFSCGTLVVLWSNLKENVENKMFGISAGFTNIFVFSGGAIYQQFMGNIIGRAPIVDHFISTSGFKSAFMFCAVSLVLALLFFATQKQTSP